MNTPNAPDQPKSGLPVNDAKPNNDKVKNKQVRFPKADERKLISENDILTIQELAQRIKVSPKTIYRWVHIGFIPHVKMGGNLRFMWSIVSLWIIKRTHPGRNEYLPLD